MPTGHKSGGSGLFALFGVRVAPDGHLLRKGILPREEIAAQQGEARHRLSFPAEQQPPGLQCQQLGRVVRQCDLCSFCAAGHIQLPARTVLFPQLSAVL